MEVKVQKTKMGAELLGSLPVEIANSASIEIFPLRDGMYLLSVKGAIDRPKVSGPLSEQERALVKKLLAIKFERRTPADVDGTLSGQEKATLASLMAKNVVNVFRSGKYENGVYNVSDAIFGHALDALPKSAPDSADGKGIAPMPQRASETTAQQQAHDPLSRGYLVLENEGDARALSGAFAEKIKAGEVSGLRAFDRKYYFIKKAFAQQWQPKIQALLEKGDKTAEEVAREIGLNAEGCRAILLHMSEDGELLEKSKGKFALA